MVLVNEERLKLEYELRQSNESSNKRISELRIENENLQQNLNEKYKSFLKNKYQKNFNYRKYIILISQNFYS